MMAMFIIGYEVILLPNYKPALLANYIKQYRPNIILSIPAYWEVMIHSNSFENVDLSCLEQIYAGGENMNPETEEAINKVLLSHHCSTALYKGLGSTELTGGATQNYENCNVIGSVGIPLVKLNCKIVDPELQVEQKYLCEGEICFSGPTVMLGYYENQAATDEIVKIHTDGQRWLHTGDIGYINEDGVVFVTGRIKRIIMTKGEDQQVTKMFPDRIEKALYAHPAVELCCVVGVPDAVRIHYPKAFIVLKSGTEPGEKLTDELIAFCKANLPEYMVPTVIEYRTDLPRTARGKVDYRALEEK